MLASGFATACHAPVALQAMLANAAAFANLAQTFPYVVFADFMPRGVAYRFFSLATSFGCSLFEWLSFGLFSCLEIFSCQNLVKRGSGANYIKIT
jgi:hypothetical protein